MVLLTMTHSMVEALDACVVPELGGARHNEEPSLEAPAVGKPISHGQIIGLWKQLATTASQQSLEQLLRGAHIYIPPPAPKPEPTSEYKALMARLRHEEQARSYARMARPAASREMFYERFHQASAFASVNQPASPADLGDDEVTHNDVHRQVTLVLNFLVSIAGVAVTLWAAARWWRTPARLFLTMGGSLIVAVAEVVVYRVYVWRLGGDKAKQEGAKEVREVVNTWVVGTGEAGGDGGEGGKILDALDAKEQKEDAQDVGQETSKSVKQGREADGDPVGGIRKRLVKHRREIWQLADG